MTKKQREAAAAKAIEDAKTLEASEVVNEAIATLERIGTDGEIRVIAITIDTADKPVVVVPKEVQSDESYCIEYWSRKKNDYSFLYRLGCLFKTVKLSVNGNNQVFGSYREKVFPGMSRQYATACISVFENDVEIRKVFDASKVDVRNYSNPVGVYNKWKALTKPEPDSDKDKDKDKTEGNDLRESKELNDLTPPERVDAFCAIGNSIIEDSNRGKLSADYGMRAIAHATNLIKMVSINMDTK